MFDLFYRFKKSDFERLNVTWLLHWQDKMIQIPSENIIVRCEIRESILNKYFLK